MAADPIGLPPTHGPAPSRPEPVPFAFVPADHPAREFLDDLLADLPARAAELPGEPEVVARLRGSVTDGVPVPERLYVSLQSTDDDGCFRASTLHWSAGAGARWDRFPADAELPSLAATLSAFGGPECVEVLRYLPSRRLTFRADGRIVKAKRPWRIDDAWDRVQAVESAARDARTVRVPRLLGVDHDVSAYSHVDVPGSPLSELAVGPVLAPLLAEAGGVHAELHRLQVAGVPAGPTPAAVLERARRDAAWTATVLPELADSIGGALAALDASVPEPATETVTCHGNLVPSHLVGAPGDWTVIDLDRAERGEAARDLALFVAGLAQDVPALADGTAIDPAHVSAVSAYLDCYLQTGGRVEESRFAWHLLAAYVHHAGLLATRNLAHHAAVVGTAARLAAALDLLEAAR